MEKYRTLARDVFSQYETNVSDDSIHRVAAMMNGFAKRYDVTLSESDVLFATGVLYTQDSCPEDLREFGGEVLAENYSNS